MGDPGEAPGDPVAPFLGGRLLLRQPRTGHRAGTDAVLLAAAVPAAPGSVLADAGAGVGTVGLAVAARAPGVTVHLIEKDGPTAALAVGNARSNGLDGRVAVHVTNLFDPAARAPLERRMDVVASNPPFYLADRVRASRDPAKVRAHVLEGGGDRDGHGAWLLALLPLLAPHGVLVMIHRPDALPALLAAAGNRLGALTVRPVHPCEGEPASRILLGGVLGSRAPLRIEPPLVLHEVDGRFTAAAEALHRGEGLLAPPQRKSRPRGPAPSS